MKAIFENRFIIIELNEEKDVVYNNWLAATTDMSDDDIRRQLKSKLSTLNCINLQIG